MVILSLCTSAPYLFTFASQTITHFTLLTSAAGLNHSASAVSGGRLNGCRSFCLHPPGGRHSEEGACFAYEYPWVAGLIYFNLNSGRFTRECRPLEVITENNALCVSGSSWRLVKGGEIGFSCCRELHRSLFCRRTDPPPCLGPPSAGPLQEDRWSPLSAALLLTTKSLCFSI